jgi:IS605 OrfB family transposase
LPATRLLTKITLPDTSVDGPALSSVYVPSGTSESALAWTGTDASHQLNVETSSDGLHFAHKVTLDETSPYRPDVALALVRTNDTIYHEDLQTANMVKNHHLVKSVSDAGWATFLTILAFKAAWAGKRAVAVPPAYTSQRCSGCGVLVSKGLSVRWHSCPECGISLHRDQNAARNIERLGQSLRRGAGVLAPENLRIRGALAPAEGQSHVSLL